MSPEQCRKLRTAVTLSIGALLFIYGTISYQLRWQLAHGYSDFVSFYTAGKILQGHQAFRLYDLGLQHQIQQEIYPNFANRQGALPFVRPPFEAWLFLPLAHFSYPTAFVLWNLFSGTCLVAIVAILRRELSELRRFSSFFLTCAMLSYFPVFLTILQGQDSILLLLVYVLAYQKLRNKQHLTAGMILGFGSLKFPLLVPFLIPLLIKSKYRLTLGFALTSILLCGLSVATVGASTCLRYPAFLMGIDKLAKGVNVPGDMPNIRGLLSIVPVLKPFPTLSIVILCIISLLLVASVIQKSSFNPLTDRQLFNLSFSFNLVVTLLVSYHCHSFDLCLLLLPIALVLELLFSDGAISSRFRNALVLGLGLILFSPFYILLNFVVGSPALLAVIVLVFAGALHLALSDAASSPPRTAIGNIPLF